MIPKKIHYCWFGGNSLSSEVRKCIASWRRFCPDYEIIEWNEKNFDVDCIRYTADAYRDRRWAYVTDYARLKIVYEQGGIYLDTDVELLRPLDPLLENKVYFGMQRAGEVATGLGFGAEAGAEEANERFCRWYRRRRHIIALQRYGFSGVMRHLRCRLRGRKGSG